MSTFSEVSGKITKKTFDKSQLIKRPPNVLRIFSREHILTGLFL